MDQHVPTWKENDSSSFNWVLILSNVTFIVNILILVIETPHLESCKTSTTEPFSQNSLKSRSVFPFYLRKNKKQQVVIDAAHYSVFSS